MKLVVGLGNPGPEYEWTRHNVGFLVLDRLVADERKGAGPKTTIFEDGRKLEGLAGAKSFTFARSKRFDALYVKPETYMNRSGDVVAPIVRSFALSPEDILVVYDDFDLPLGTKRLRPHGGAGTHNGMRSIVSSLGYDRFPRLRVGIGAARTDAVRHVLEEFTPRERTEIEICAAEAAESIAAWLAGELLENVMTRFHSRWNQS